MLKRIYDLSKVDPSIEFLKIEVKYWLRLR
jgi:hypothetical protein